MHCQPQWMGTAGLRVGGRGGERSVHLSLTPGSGCRMSFALANISAGVIATRVSGAQCLPNGPWPMGLSTGEYEGSSWILFRPEACKSGNRRVNQCREFQGGGVAFKRIPWVI